MNDVFTQCLNLLQRDDVKKDIKKLISPVITFISHEFMPYIYMVLLLMVVNFLLLLAIFSILIYYARKIN
jgi:hypothetical protein